MSYTKTGYIKSIYGIIADAIKEEIKILLKSDYFAYQSYLKNKTHTQGTEKGKAVNAATHQCSYRCSVCVTIFFTINSIFLYAICLLGKLPERNSFANRSQNSRLPVYCIYLTSGGHKR